MNKKAFFPVITVGILIVLAIILAVIFGGLSFLSFFLTKSLLMLIGGFVLVVAGLALLKGIAIPYYVWIIGIILILLPFVVTQFKDITLSSLGI